MQMQAIIPAMTANAMHPAPTAIPAIAPTASPLCEAAGVVGGIGDTDVVDAPLLVRGSVEVDVRVDGM